MKSVCIIGAGPAGLVAAKTFLENGSYAVTVYETADRVGGMWRAQPGEDGDKCSPEMCTNLSRFTVAFSDLSWSSVDLTDPTTEAPPSQTPPMFPKAWQVGRYLSTYAQKFDIDTKVLCNTRITQAKRSETSEGWEISFTNNVTKQQGTRTYDYLVVASGFFDCPMGSFDPSPTGTSDNFQHSSRFRSLTDLTDKAGKIVVIGGGISGAEAAAQAAFQISSAKHSPNAAKTAHSDSTVYHIVNRPFYCLPRYIPQISAVPGPAKTPAPSFLPLDMVLYNLSRRAEGEISACITTVPFEKAKKGHKFMQTVIGGQYSLMGLPRSRTSVDRQAHYGTPGYVGITDTYEEFVRSGLIVMVQGWVESVKAVEHGDFTVTFRYDRPTYPGNELPSVVADVTGIIQATGYKTNLNFFDDNLKQLLDYDQSCPRIPLLLSRGSVFAPKVHNLGFVGFYEGPYWSVMEMQARLIVETWAQEEHDHESHGRDAKIFKSNDAEEMREALKKDPLRVPQFWMGDYVGLVEELARHIGVKRNDSRLGTGMGPAFASRYPGGVTSADASGIINEVADIIEASSSKAQFTAAAVFRGMQGDWSLHRKIQSRKSTSPSGIFLGTAHLHPRVPTAALFAAEYLYVEEGDFTMENGLSFPATRRYIYRYNELDDKVTAWFADEDGESVGALFNTWEFETPSLPYSGWVAKGHHWCEPDTYKNACEFKFDGASLESFNITYQVEGPNKDYSHQSWYAREDTRGHTDQYD